MEGRTRQGIAMTTPLEQGKASRDLGRKSNVSSHPSNKPWCGRHERRASMVQGHKRPMRACEGRTVRPPREAGELEAECRGL